MSKITIAIERYERRVEFTVLYRNTAFVSKEISSFFNFQVVDRYDYNSFRCTAQ